jgi:hypothetical protein
MKAESWNKFSQLTPVSVCLIMRRQDWNTKPKNKSWHIPYVIWTNLHTNLAVNILWLQFNVWLWLSEIHCIECWRFSKSGKAFSVLCGKLPKAYVIHSCTVLVSTLSLTNLWCSSGKYIAPCCNKESYLVNHFIQTPITPSQEDSPWTGAGNCINGNSISWQHKHRIRQQMHFLQLTQRTWNSWITSLFQVLT